MCVCLKNLTNDTTFSLFLKSVRQIYHKISNIILFSTVIYLLKLSIQGLPVKYSGVHKKRIYSHSGHLKTKCRYRIWCIFKLTLQFVDAICQHVMNYNARLWTHSFRLCVIESSLILPLKLLVLPHCIYNL